MESKKWNKKFNLVLGYYYPTTETLLQYKRDREYRKLKKKNNESNQNKVRNWNYNNSE